MSPIRTNCWMKLHSFSLNREMFSVLTTENERNLSKSWTLCVFSSVVWFSNRITLHYSQFSPHFVSSRKRTAKSVCWVQPLWRRTRERSKWKRSHSSASRGAGGASACCPDLRFRRNTVVSVLVAELQLFILSGMCWKHLTVSGAHVCFLQMM